MSALIRLSIVIATIGRPSLLTALVSLAPQLHDEDECLVMFDAPMHGGWGYIAHNRGMDAATGTHLIFIGDDDDFLPGALDLVRECVALNPDRVHIFRIQTRPGMAIPHVIPTNEDYHHDLIPQGGIVAPRNLPAGNSLPRWLPINSADRQFAQDAAAATGNRAIWHPEAIGRWKTPNWPGWAPITEQPTYTPHQQRQLAGAIS